MRDTGGTSPTDDGIRFLTSYDYRVRFGALGRAFDALCFRPLLGWATAWSFDRLRLWAEKGVAPSVSLERGLLHVLARTVVGFVWLYQGAIPKLIFRHADELAMIRRAGVPSGSEGPSSGWSGGPKSSSAWSFSLLSRPAGRSCSPSGL